MSISGFIRRFVFGDFGHQPTPLTAAERLHSAGIYGRIGLIVGIIGTVIDTLFSCGWFKNHHDVGNGAVLWFGMIFMVGIVTFLFALPCSVIAVRRGLRIGWLGVIFSITPIPSGFAILHIAMAVNGFHVTS